MLFSKQKQKIIFCYSFGAPNRPQMTDGSERVPPHYYYYYPDGRKMKGGPYFPPLMARSRDPIITSSIKISEPRLSLFFPPKFCF